MKFIVKQNLFGDDCHGLWYIYAGNSEYLWNDLMLHISTGGKGGAGYYKTKVHAEATLRAYKLLQLSKEKHLVFLIKQSQTRSGKWYIVAEDVNYYKTTFFPCLHKDLEIHPGTAYCNSHYDKDAGYYNSVIEAKITLKQFKEKHNMANKIEVEVRINGIPTSLHEISEQTLLVIREASKSKPVPVFHIAESHSDEPRLIFKVTQEIADNVGRFVCVDKCSKVVYDSFDIKAALMGYKNICELKLDEV